MFRKNKFEDEFEFKVSSVSGMEEIQDKKVSAVLSARAQDFSWACNQQEKALKRIVDEFPTSQHIKEREEEILEAEKQVAKFKKAFWNAHALAKKAGFAVRDNYGDYLPLSIEP